MPGLPLKSAACARIAIGAVLTSERGEREVRGRKYVMKRKNRKVTRKGARQPDIYTGGRAKNRTQNGEAGCAAGVLPEAATLNLNGRTPNPNRARQTRAGRERRKSRPARRLIVYSLFL
jgi:hypothetical protein